MIQCTKSKTIQVLKQNLILQHTVVAIVALTLLLTAKVSAADPLAYPFAKNRRLPSGEEMAYRFENNIFYDLPIAVTSKTVYLTGQSGKKYPKTVTDTVYHNQYTFDLYKQAVADNLNRQIDAVNPKLEAHGWSTLGHVQVSDLPGILRGELRDKKGKIVRRLKVSFRKPNGIVSTDGLIIVDLNNLNGARVSDYFDRMWYEEKGESILTIYDPVTGVHFDVASDVCRNPIWEKNYAQSIKNAPEEKEEEEPEACDCPPKEEPKVVCDCPDDEPTYVRYEPRQERYPTYRRQTSAPRYGYHRPPPRKKMPMKRHVDQGGPVLGGHGDQGGPVLGGHGGSGNSGGPVLGGHRYQGR